MGAILVSVHGVPLALFATTISEADPVLVEATKGDPAYMAEWGMLAILVDLKLWTFQPRGTHAVFVVQADSTAALGVAIRPTSTKPMLNTLATEVGLVLDEIGTDTL